MKPQLWILMLIVTTVALAACSHEQSTPTGPLLSVVWRGGLCQYGACSTTFELSGDGGYRLTEGDGAETFGVIESTLVDALPHATSAADFEAVRVRGSTEICPTAYDGQEIIYVFHRSGGDERMSTCEYVLEWELPPFPQALAILDAVGR